MADSVGETSEEMSNASFSEMSLNILTDDESDASPKNQDKDTNRKCDIFHGIYQRGSAASQRYILIYLMNRT